MGERFFKNANSRVRSPPIDQLSARMVVYSASTYTISVMDDEYVSANRERDLDAPSEYQHSLTSAIKLSFLRISLALLIVSAFEGWWS